MSKILISHQILTNFKVKQENNCDLHLLSGGSGRDIIQTFDSVWSKNSHDFQKLWIIFTLLIAIKAGAS